jgi:hypothetical protein
MNKQKQSVVIGALLIAITLILFLPSLSFSGSLEPSDPPGPTMKTLNEIYNKPVWDMFDKVFIDWPDNPRFAVCDNATPETSDDMVLDKETGLVWERSPVLTEPGRDWFQANFDCMWKILGGRQGWRLPTIQELASLVDMSAPRPRLPIGHPFNNIRGFYWSSTTCSKDDTTALTGGFFCNACMGFCRPKESGYLYDVWCVRGGPGTDSQSSEY